MAGAAGGVGFIVGGAAVLWLSRAFPPAASIAADPALLPRAVGVLLIVTGTGVTLTELLRARMPATSTLPRPRPRPNAEPAGGTGTSLAVLPLIAGTAVYAWLAFTTWYVIATALFLGAAALILGQWPGRAGLLRVATFAVVFSVVVQYLFSTLLNVPLSAPALTVG